MMEQGAAGVQGRQLADDAGAQGRTLQRKVALASTACARTRLTAL